MKSTATPDGSKKKEKQHIGFLAQDVLAVEQSDGFASKKDDMLVIAGTDDNLRKFIKIGERTNIQDNSVIHLENDQGVIVGNDVTVGHNVILHGCKVGDGVLDLAHQLPRGDLLATLFP